MNTKIIKTRFGSYTKYQCNRCNRFFSNLNLHDKTSRCGRAAGFKGGLGPGDKERIAKVGLDKAIKRNKK